ncbi:glycosyltransferase [Synechococcus sp. CB0205]|uniref:CgeB family protein n=1 Tax=Synechococcus sp. CB0205 TaxID=232363 RepID=UPI00020024C6|nr:glycosyltransferase [Synechococcus sp. CB0205]
MAKRLPLLLIADTSVPEALGSKFLRGAQQAGLDPKRDLLVAYTSPAPAFSPSMGRLRGKVFYRLADRRSWEWWGFQRKLIALIEQHKPRLVLVTGILPLAPQVFQAIRASGGRIVNYLTDDPWNPIHRRRCFLRNLKDYDHIFSTKEALRQRLEAAGTLSTSWLPFAYDPELHHPIDFTDPEAADVLFVGTGAAERLPWLEALADLPGLRRRIHGSSWEGLSTPGWEKGPAVVGEDYCKAMGSARVVLGLLRQANGDLSTDRSYEIGAIGGCGLYQDTSEHRALLQNYPDSGFFKDPTELRARVEALLRDPERQEQLRQGGAQTVRRPQHTYGARLRTILEWSQAKP